MVNITMYNVYNCIIVFSAWPVHVYVYVIVLYIIYMNVLYILVGGAIGSSDYMDS